MLTSHFLVVEKEPHCFDFKRKIVFAKLLNGRE